MDFEVGDGDSFVAVVGGKNFQAFGWEHQMNEVVGFAGKLHGVGAHVSGLNDPNGGDGQLFDVAVAGDEDDIVVTVDGDAADNLFFGADFESLHALGNSTHERDLFGGEG